MDETTWAIAFASTAAAACLGTLLLYARNKASAATNPTLSRGGNGDSSSSSRPTSSSINPQGSRASPVSSSSSSNSTAHTSGLSSHDAPDVWEERRRRGISAASSHGLKKEPSLEKPFSSSYYYAHNNSKATGGYKDGLSMEDFTMNGPRLLSRGGKPVTAREDEDPNERAIPESISTGTTSTATSPAEDYAEKTLEMSKKSRRTHPISKYLWDDPGDASGVAAIRIEQLPGPASNRPGLDWATARSLVTRIDTQWRDGGMILLVQTSGDVDYSLTIPKFYGDVEGVEHISKTKRLIVRIKKKRGMFSRSNTKTWPHPHKKIE